MYTGSGEIELDFCVYSTHHESPTWIKGYAIFHDTSPRNLPQRLFGVATWEDLDRRWIHACRETFKMLPRIDGPYKLKRTVSADVFSHDGMRQISKRLYVRVYDDRGASFLDKFIPKFDETMQRFNRKSAYKSFIDAINMLRDFEGIPTQKEIVKQIGAFRFDIMVSVGVLKSLKLFTRRHRVYYVSSHIL